MDSSECTVQGSLALVLRFERAMGIAPVKFEPLGDHFKMTMCRKFAIYNYVFALIMHISSLSAIIIFNHEDTLTIFPFGFLLSTCTSILISSLASYGGSGRLKRMINYLFILQTINCQYIDPHREKPKNKNIDIWVKIYLFFSGLFLGIHAFKMFVFITHDPLMKLTLLIFAFDYNRIVLLKIEDVLFKMEIYNALKALREKINNLLQENSNADTIGCISKSLCGISKSYITISTLVEDVNKTSGFFMFLLLASSVSYLMITICNLINLLHNYYGSGKGNIAYIGFPIFWGSYHFLNAVFFIEPCHLLGVEIKLLKVTLCELMYKMTSVGKPILLEMKLMAKLLVLHEPIIKPWRMYRVQRSLLITVVGFVTTYLMLMVQVIAGIWNNSHD